MGESMWGQIFFWVMVVALGLVGILVVAIVITTLITFGIFWGARLIFMIRPQHCRRCGDRFPDSEMAFYAFQHNLICVSCRSISGQLN